MKKSVGTGPPPLAVSRRFETDRLAKDFQIRAYEQAAREAAMPAKTPKEQLAVGQETEAPSQGGIAA